MKYQSFVVVVVVVFLYLLLQDMFEVCFIVSLACIVIIAHGWVGGYSPI